MVEIASTKSAGAKVRACCRYIRSTERDEGGLGNVVALVIKILCMLKLSFEQVG